MRKYPPEAQLAAHAFMSTSALLGGACIATAIAVDLRRYNEVVRANATS
jgi:hypothetical protein